PTPPPPRPPPVPYTTLFRSPQRAGHEPAVPRQRERTLPTTEAPADEHQWQLADQLGQRTRRAPHVRRAAAEHVALPRLDPFQHRSEEHTSELQSRFDLVCRL